MAVEGRESFPACARNIPEHWQGPSARRNRAYFSEQERMNSIWFELRHVRAVSGDEFQEAGIKYGRRIFSRRDYSVGVGNQRRAA